MTATSDNVHDSAGNLGQHEGGSTAQPVSMSTDASAPHGPGAFTMLATSRAGVPPEITPEDARLAPLIAMFPNVDVGVIESVLDTVNGDHDRAVDMLLGMTDPTYVSERPRPGPGQGETDEEMARRLAAEEEFEAAWHDDSQNQPSVGRGARRRVNVPANRSAPPASGDGLNDTLAQVQDQVFKIAETGKKTFMSIVSKARQKLAEFDNPSPMPRHRDWSDPTYPNEEEAPETNSSMYEHRVSVPYVAPPGQQLPSTQQKELLGFDVSELPGHTQQPKATTPISIPAASGAATSAGTTSPPGPASYDAARMGLLPRRPVSLIDNTTAGKAKQPRVEDDDDVEYVENPFENPK